jgi:hypothetical protein
LILACGESSTLIGEITDISRYEEVRASYEPEYVAHFPIHIPAEASNVIFLYIPRFMQGPNQFHLDLTLPNESIVQEYEFFSSQAIQILDEENPFPEDRYFPLMETLEGDPYAFPESFQIMILYSEPAGNTPDFSWNHGTEYGVSISQEKSRIIYWFIFW